MPDAEILFRTLIGHLKEMDAAAGPVRGQPTGLNDCGRWRRQDLKRPSAEREWTRELAARLGCASECAYPDRPRERCDLVIDRAWIEVKGAWPAWWTERGKRAIYEAYLFHPLRLHGRLTKGHSAALDVLRLRRLRAADAGHRGLLLVVFDRIDQPCDADLDLLARLTGVDSWPVCRDEWRDRHHAGRRVVVRFWMQPVA